MTSDHGEGVSDTAIVIRNIPFLYPEGDFRAKLFPQLKLNPPYAFNYHIRKTDGLFLGVAFANFKSPDDAQAAMDLLNDYELETRKLRVEKKWLLPKDEEEATRLERLSRRHGTTQASAQGPGLVNGSYAGPTQLFDYSTIVGDILPARLRPRIILEGHPSPSLRISITYHLYVNKGLDMNDPETLGFYTTLQILRNDPRLRGTTLQFPLVLTSAQRLIIRALANKLGLEHATHGDHSDRYVTVRLPGIVPKPELKGSESDNLMASRPSPPSSVRPTDGSSDPSKYLSSCPRVRHPRRVLSVGDIPNHIVEPPKTT